MQVILHFHFSAAMKPVGLAGNSRTIELLAPQDTWSADSHPSPADSLAATCFYFSIRCDSIFYLFDSICSIRFIGQMKSNNGESFQVICDFKKQRNVCLVHSTGLLAYDRPFV